MGKWASLLAVSLLTGCGGDVLADKGTPWVFPPQAALSFSIAPAPGKICNATNPILGFPSSENAGVAAELECDPSEGCVPDMYIVVDGDRGAMVACTVSPKDLDFALQLHLDVDGSRTNAPSVHFGLVGLSSSSGGTVSIDESNSAAGGKGTQSDCKLTILPPSGVIARGRIWGSFECSAFKDAVDLGDTACELRGKFLFETCRD